jgi:HrpA-like RNA helicase
MSDSDDDWCLKSGSVEGEGTSDIDIIISEDAYKASDTKVFPYVSTSSSDAESDDSDSTCDSDSCSSNISVNFIDFAKMVKEARTQESINLGVSPKTNEGGDLTQLTISDDTQELVITDDFSTLQHVEYSASGVSADESNSYADPSLAQTKPIRNSGLPIDERRDDIIKLIRENRVVILSGSTGCGKVLF